MILDFYLYSYTIVLTRGRRASPWYTNDQRTTQACSAPGSIAVTVSWVARDDRCQHEYKGPQSNKIGKEGFSWQTISQFS